jgi:hypothetical protein
VKLPPGLLGDNALAVAQDDDISIDDEVWGGSAIVFYIYVLILRFL